LRRVKLPAGGDANLNEITVARGFDALQMGTAGSVYLRLANIQGQVVFNEALIGLLNMQSANLEQSLFCNRCKLGKAWLNGLRVGYQATFEEVQIIHWFP